MIPQRLIASVFAVAVLITSSFGAALAPLSNVDTLSTVAGSSAGDTVLVGGYYQSGDGGGGNFEWIASGATEDKGVWFYGSGGAGSAYRWHRIGAELNVRYFGAKGDGIAEDGDAIQKTLDAAVAGSYPVVHFGAGRFKISGVLDTMTRAPGQTIFKVLYSNREIVTEGGYSYDREDSGVIAILELGFGVTTAKPLRLAGDGAVIYTTQEVFSPTMLLVRPNFKGLTIEDLTFERTSTTNDEPTASDMPMNTSGPHPGTRARALGVDTTSGSNRGGISFLQNEDGVSALEVDEVVLRRVKLTNCTFGVTNHDKGLVTEQSGLLRHMIIDQCAFTYEKGLQVGALSEFPHSLTYPGDWIGLLEITDSLFDGATTASVANTAHPDLSLPPENCIFGGPCRMVCTGNTFRHFSFEGMNLGPRGTVGELASTAGTTNAPVSPVPAIGTQKTFAVNSGTPIPADLVAGDFLEIGEGGGTWKYVSSNSTALTITLEWPQDPTHPGQPYPGNPVSGSTTPLTVGDQIIWHSGVGDHWYLVKNNLIDGNTAADTAANGTPAFGYGCPGIWIGGVKCWIIDNHIINCVTGIFCRVSQNHEFAENSAIIGNLIEPFDCARELCSAQGISTIDLRLSANPSLEFYVADNRVVFRSTYAFTDVNGFHPCIGLGLGVQGTFTGNSVVSLAPPRTDSIGIAVTSPTAYLADNITQNMGNGIVPLPYQYYQTYVIDSHSSNGDLTSVILPPGSLWRHQHYAWNVPATGWYRVAATGGIQQFAGVLSVADNGSSTGGEVKAALDFNAYGLGVNITQQEFLQPSAGWPAWSAVLVGGVAVPEVFVHLRSNAGGTPYNVNFTTETPGVVLANQPQAGITVSAWSPNSPSAGQTTLATSSAHGLSAGGVVYLFDDASNAVLKTFTVASVTDPTHLVLTGVPAAQPTTLFSTGFADPAQYASTTRALAFSTSAINSTGSIVGNGVTSTGSITGNSILSNGTITGTGILSAGTQSASSVGYGFQSDAGNDTGMYRAGENNIGIAAGGTTQLNVNSNGLVIKGTIGLNRILSVRSGTSPFGTANIASSGAVNYVVTVTGASVGDTVLLGHPSSAVSAYNYIAYVSAADTVTVRATNATTTTQSAPGLNKTLRVTVLSFWDGTQN